MNNENLDEKTTEKSSDLPQVNFAMFLLSLATSAQIHMGLMPDPATNKTSVSLPFAKQTIDILALLQEKTKGNLDEQEGKLLEQVLYQLRMQYVEKQGK